MAKKQDVQTVEIDATVDPDAVEYESPESSLYLKYRPRNFDEVVGHKSTIGGLKKTLATGSLNTHAIMLTGPRGTGKTTTARLIAASLNCPKSKGGNPCGKCDICITVMNGGGSSGFVQEINCAEYRGIDNMRALLQTIDLGVSTKYKVIILDEVHQLTAEAESVLLKTLEEPPNSQVIFILATTDPQKVRDTIRSRTVLFKFNTLSNGELEQIVLDVANKEAIKIDEPQVKAVVNAGNGSARDTLSSLERVRMGIPISDSDDRILDLIDGLLEKDLASVLVTVAELAQSPDFDPQGICDRVLSFCRDSLVYQQSSPLVQGSPDWIERVRRGAKWPQGKLVRDLDSIAQTMGQMRVSANNRIVLEAGLSKLLVPSARGQVGPLADAIDEMKDLLTQYLSGAPAPVIQVEEPEDEVEPDPETEPEATEPVEEEQPVVESEDELEEKPKKGKKKKKAKKSEGVDVDTLSDFIIDSDIKITSRVEKLIEEAEFELDDTTLFIITPGRVVPRAQDPIRELILDEYGDYIDDIEFEESDD